MFFLQSIKEKIEYINHISTEKEVADIEILDGESQIIENDKTYKIKRVIFLNNI